MYVINTYLQHGYPGQYGAAGGQYPGGKPGYPPQQQPLPSPTYPPQRGQAPPYANGGPPQGPYGMGGPGYHLNRQHHPGMVHPGGPPHHMNGPPGAPPYGNPNYVSQQQQPYQVRYLCFCTFFWNFTLRV